MKKIVFIFLFFIPLWAFSQTIPDSNFETWKDIVYHFPTGWQTSALITRISPGYMGNYAIRVQSNSTATQAGSFGYGSRNANILKGGTPFAARPDSFAGYFAYHIATGDTATVCIVLKNNGTVVGTDTIPIWGTNTGYYALRKSRINYRSAQTPDSLILIANCTNPAHINPASYLIADQFGFTNSTVSVPNGDFESWYTRSYHDPASWITQNSLGLTTGEYPVTDTTDHFGGHLAARLKNNNQGTYYQEGYMYLGKMGSKGLMPGIAVNQIDTFFTGYYKFFPSNGDTCTFAVSMFRHDTLVGSGIFLSKDTVSTWTPFVVPITYTSGFSGRPDSAAIQVAAFRLGSASSPHGNSILLIDDLSFNTFSTGFAATPESKSKFSVAPNPFSDFTMLQLELPFSESISLKIYTLEGRELKVFPATTFPAGKQSVRISSEGLAPGIYFLVTGNNTYTQTQKIIVTP